MAAPLLRGGKRKGGFGQVSREFCPVLSAGAVDDLADLPLAEPELSRQSPVVAAVEPGPDVPVPGVALQVFPFGDVQALSAAQQRQLGEGLKADGLGNVPLFLGNVAHGDGTGGV